LSHRNQQSELVVAKDILKYFLRNPAAADDLEGIARWRLLDEKIHQSLEETNQALDWLVARGLLEVDSRSGSGTLFRLNARKRAEIERFLDEGPTEFPGKSKGDA
jgi:hypothetical protein